MKLTTNFVLGLFDDQFELMTVVVRRDGEYVELEGLYPEEEAELSVKLDQSRLVAILVSYGEEVELHLDDEFKDDLSLDRILSMAEERLGASVHKGHNVPDYDPYA